MICYLVLLLLTFLCILPFYLLLINATRAHVDIQRSFSVIPGASLIRNIGNVLDNNTILIVRGMLNSLLVASGTVLVSVYFSALTAYALHAYSFRFRKAVFNFILLIMTIPTQVGALGFVASWNNYFTPSLILTKAENKTLPLWIAYLRSADFTKFDMGQVYTMVALSVFPVIIVYLFLSKYIVQGVTLGSVKG